MKLSFPILCLLGLFPFIAFSSCSEKTVKRHIGKAPGEQGAFSERITSGNFDHKRGEDGMVEMKSDKRSAFEGTRFQSEGTGFDRKQFDKTAFDDSSKSVEKTAWQNAKTYDGDMSTPEFAKQSSSFNRDQSDFTNRDYTTSSARENDHSEARGMDQQFEHTINDDVIRKREELARPKIISSQEEQARTIEEIRSMMGRED